MAEGKKASVEGGRSFWGSGKWATERMLAAMKEGRPLSPSELRTNDTLRNEEWKAFDLALVEGFRTRLRAVADLIAAGLTTPLSNAMAKTVLEYDKIGDMDPATVSMDGMARSENDRIEFESAALPIPITHKDFFINIRKLMASRLGAEALDTTQIRVSARLVAEEIERMLIIGGKQFQSLPIYGYTTHPNRNTLGFGGSVNWANAAKTGEEIIIDIQSMMSKAEEKGFYGPYWVYFSKNASVRMENDYKESSERTIRQRVMDIDGIDKFTSLDMMPANNVVLLQPTPDVVTLVDGERPQNVQWDVNGGFGVNFKVFAIQVPLVRADADNNSGIVHMS